MGALKRTLGLGACIFFGVGSILGAGIYTIIGKIAGYGGNMTWLAFSIAWITALMTAFSYAELSSAFPRAGGEYEYAKKAFGKKWGVGLGSIISLNGIVSGATVAVGFAGYLSQLLDFNVLMGSLGIIALIFLVNISGIRESSAVNIGFTIIEIGGLLLVIYAAFPKMGEVDLMQAPPGGMGAIFTASALAFFAFIGFEEIVKLAEETHEPEKNIPRALFWAGGIVAVVYLLVAISAVSALPYDKLAQASGPLAAVAESRFGRGGIIAISIIALFATSNTILSNMLGSSRVLLNMSKETKAMQMFAKVSAKRKTPVAALVLILVVMAGFALIGDIEFIARIANIFIFITFIIVNACVIVLRRKHPQIKRPFSIPGAVGKTPVIPVLGILFTLVLFGFNLYSLFANQA